MTQYTLTHLSDAALLRDLATLVARDRDRTATLLAHVAEVDVRRLYVAAGYSSMFAYCIEELRLSDDAAYKRIRAARAARQFPALFTAVAEGRLHLTAVCLIAPHLTAESLDGLIEAATHRRKSEIEGYLARRFPLLNLGARERVASLIRPIAPLASAGVTGVTDQLVLGRVVDEGKEDRLASGRADDMSNPIALGRVVDGVDPGQLALGRVLDGSNPGQLALGRVLGGSGHDQLVLGRVGEGSDRGQDDGGSGSGHAGGPATKDSKQERLAPQQVPAPFVADLSESMRAAEQHFLVQLTISKRVHDKLRHAQALLSHSVAPDDLAQVLERALDALIGKLENRKVGAPSNRRARARSAAGGETGRPGMKRSLVVRNRYVPARVRRAVWVRDKGQCTFVSAAGHRCTARRLLEFDHIEPVARGGKATVDGLRLRCRSHNQFEAERTFGADFMSRKRRQARLARAQSRAESGGQAPAETRAEAHADTRDPAGATDPASVCADHLAMQDRLGGRADPS